MNLFVGGVHAAGKTFLLKPACDQLGLRYATASQLIRQRRGHENWSPSRLVTDVEGNQRLLVAAIDELAQAGERVVLDGHFVLRRDVEVHQEIGVETFAQLRLRAALLFETPSQVIAARLAERGDQSWTISEIERFAGREASHARAICRELRMPLACLHMPTQQAVCKAISRLIEEP